MLVKCSDIVNFFEEFSPSRLAEDWDNVGLLVGSRSHEIKRIMVCLDVTSQVADEAADMKIDLIVSHHPLIFKGLKRINEDDWKGNIIYKLIRSNISVYSAHTNLDFTVGGVNEYLAKCLGLTEIRNLKKYKTEKLYKLVVFVPEESADAVREAMSGAGGGCIGNYSDCSFMTKGTGTFKPLEGTNPYIGSIGKLERVSEYKLETIVPEEKLKQVLAAMIKTHPYEEVAYDVYALDIKGKEYGMGKIGHLEKPQSLKDFISTVKRGLNIDSIRLIGDIEREIKTAAVFCGSFDDDWSGVMRAGADVLVTGDIKYHSAMDAIERGMCVIDAGHFNTERIITSHLVELLAKRFPETEVISNSVEKDPFKIT